MQNEEIKTEIKNEKFKINDVNDLNFLRSELNNEYHLINESLFFQFSPKFVEFIKKLPLIYEKIGKESKPILVDKNKLSLNKKIVKCSKLIRFIKFYKSFQISEYQNSKVINFNSTQLHKLSLLVSDKSSLSEIIFKYDSTEGTNLNYNNYKITPVFRLFCNIIKNNHSLKFLNLTNTRMRLNSLIMLCESIIKSKYPIKSLLLCIFNSAQNDLNNSAIFYLSYFIMNYDIFTNLNLCILI